MRTAGPAARATLAFAHLAPPHIDPFGPRLFFLRRRNPADPFIAGEGRQIEPHRPDSVMRKQHPPEVIGQFMDDTARKVWLVHKDQFKGSAVGCHPDKPCPAKPAGAVDNLNLNH